jgi:hypothetical protein
MYNIKPGYITIRNTETDSEHNVSNDVILDEELIKELFKKENSDKNNTYITADKPTLEDDDLPIGDNPYAVGKSSLEDNAVDVFISDSELSNDDDVLKDESHEINRFLLDKQRELDENDKDESIETDNLIKFLNNEIYDSPYAVGKSLLEDSPYIVDKSLLEDSPYIVGKSSSNYNTLKKSYKSFDTIDKEYVISDLE